MNMHNPAHPGLVLRESLENISVTETAQRLGVTRAALSTAKPPSARKWQCVYLFYCRIRMPPFGCACKPPTIYGRRNSAITIS